jgi:hypothetical protein
LLKESGKQAVLFSRGAAQMATIVSVTRKLEVPALLTINDPAFKHWYSLGVWWAMYGDGQAKGVYDDCYLIVNLTSHIKAGWYDNVEDGWFPMLGFELGMVHGGYLVSKPHDFGGIKTLVTLTDPDFQKGYAVGREYCFHEAPLEGRIFSDTLFCEAVQEWATGYAPWREPDAVLRYVLGCRIGELSGALIPNLLSELTSEAVTGAIGQSLQAANKPCEFFSQGASHAV